MITLARRPPLSGDAPGLRLRQVRIRGAGVRGPERRARAQDQAGAAGADQGREGHAVPQEGLVAQQWIHQLPKVR